MDIASRGPGRFTPGAQWAVLVLLLLCCNKASAAALTHLAPSVGLFAALAALVAVKAWPAYLAPSALSTGGVLLVAGAALWWWRTRMNGRAAGFAAVPGMAGGATLCRVPGGRGHTCAEVVLPRSLDRDRLLTQLRCQFVQVQDAWDRREMQTLQALTTPEMLAELCQEVTECKPEDADPPRSTDIVVLRCELIGFEALAQACVVSVEFSGLMRESAAGGAIPFRELWMLTQSNASGAGWRLARHQALF